IAAADGHYTHADESNHRLQIDATQLTDGDEQKRVGRSPIADRRAPNKSNIMQKTGYDIKPLRFARGDDHECILLADEGPELGNDRFFFALARGSEDPDAATGDEGDERAPDLQRLFARRVIDLNLAGR